VRSLIIPAIVTVSIIAPLVAHDMWIEPSSFLPKAGQVVTLRLRVGQDFIGDPIPRSSALINQFVVEDKTGRKPIIGREGFDPAGFLRAGSTGMQVIGYRSNASVLELPAETFNTYLKEEGLEAIAALRSRRNETMKPTRELFYRCAKSLLLSGVRTQAEGDRTLGFTLELTAERNPYTLRDGEDLPVRLTYDNKPLAAALVVAINRAEDHTADGQGWTSSLAPSAYRSVAHQSGPHDSRRCW
jgi:uncharacterized GH25 family protein